MTPSIGFSTPTDTELQCRRCGHAVMLRGGSLLKPCPACMHIEFDYRAARREAPTSTRADAITAAAETVLAEHSAWLSLPQRQGLARALGELLTRLEEERE